jgi:hypothetical protein
VKKAYCSVRKLTRVDREAYREIREACQAAREAYCSVRKLTKVDREAYLEIREA